MQRDATMHVSIRVKPGARRPGVGGRYGDGMLVVAVHEAAVKGRATLAALSALAEALGCGRDEVVLVRGRTSRSKVVQVPKTVQARYRQLLDT